MNVIKYFLKYRKERHRYQFWPIRIKLLPDTGWSKGWFIAHGWQTGDERVSVEKTGYGMIPGFRKVFGWTLHFGRLKIIFGNKGDY